MHLAGSTRLGVTVKVLFRMLITGRALPQGETDRGREKHQLSTHQGQMAVSVTEATPKISSYQCPGLLSSLCSACGAVQGTVKGLRRQGLGQSPSHPARGLHRTPGALPLEIVGSNAAVVE